jgi:hypothetical protein
VGNVGFLIHTAIQRVRRQLRARGVMAPRIEGGRTDA